MAVLTANNQRLVNYLGAVSLNLATSVFAVGTTTVYRLDSNGNVLSWQNGRASNLNTMTTIPAYGNFQVNPSTNITVSDALFAIDTAPVSPVGYFFGDSITAGAGASTNNQRWSTLVSRSLGLTEQNKGMSSTVLQNTNPVLASNGRDRYAADISPVDASTKVFILYGLNDLRYNGVDFSVANYKNDLTEVVDGLIASGVAPINITLGSPPFILLTGYAIGSPFNAGTTIKHEQYRDAVAEVAFEKGCKFADVYRKMLAVNDSAGFISTDSIHPNSSGHHVIASAMLEASVPTIAPSPTFYGQVLWLDSSDASTITTINTNEAREWRDKSGRGNHFLAPLSNSYPNINATGKGGLNVLTFNGSTDYMTGRVLEVSRRNFSFFIALKSNDLARQGVYFSHDAEVVYTSNFGLQQLSNLLQFFNFSASGSVVNTTLSLPSTWFVFSVTSTAAGAACNVITSGGTTSATTAALLDSMLPPGCIIGRFHQSSSFSFWASFDVGEIRLYKGAVSSGDRTNIETEMATKWI